jgi:hypothetical protein
MFEYKASYVHEVPYALFINYDEHRISDSIFSFPYKKSIFFIP